MREFVENDFFRRSLEIGISAIGYGKVNVPGLMASIGQVSRGGVPEKVVVRELDEAGDFPFPQDLEAFIGRRDGIYTLGGRQLVSMDSYGMPFAYVYDGAVFAASNGYATVTYDGSVNVYDTIGFSDAVYVAGRIIIGGCIVDSGENWRRRVVWMDAGGSFESDVRKWNWVELDSDVLCLGRVGRDVVVVVTENCCYVGHIVEEPVVGVSFSQVSRSGAFGRMARCYNENTMVYVSKDGSLMVVGSDGVKRLAFPSECIGRRLSGCVYGWFWNDDMWLAGEGGGLIITPDLRIGEMVPMVTSAGWEGELRYRYVLFNPLRIGTSGLTRVTQVNVSFSGDVELAEVALGYRMESGGVYRLTDWVRASAVGVVKRNVVGESFVVGVRWAGDAVLTDLSIGWQKHDKRNYRGSVSVSSSIA